MKIKKSLAHRQLIALKKRGHLNSNENQYLRYLNLGYEGEISFSNNFDLIMSEFCTTIHDFRFIINGSERQIDTLAIFNNKIVLFEVKNYNGNLVFQDNNFYTYKTNRLLKSPIQQINDTSDKFTQLLKQLNYSIPIEKYVIFLNNNFHLFNAPIDEMIVTNAQLPAFLENLKKNNFPLKSHANSIRQRILMCYNEITRQCDVNYTFNTINKGIFCRLDGEKLVENGHEKYICKQCGSFYHQKDIIIEVIQDFQSLFPDEKVTYKNIYDFTDGRISYYKLRKIMNRYYERIGTSRMVYFVDKENDH